VSLWSALFGALLLDRLPLKADQAVLDLGCGTGFPLLELAQRLGTSCRVTGADPWLAAMRRARSKQITQQVTTADLVLAVGEALPFPTGHFDLVVSNLGINNFAAPLDVLAEVARVTRPGGLLALTTNLRGHMAGFYAAFAETLEEIGHPELRPALDAQEAHRTTVAALRVLLASAGFYTRRVDEQATILRYVDGSAFLHHTFTQVAFLEGWRSFLPPELEAEVFACLEANLNRVAAARGELALTIPMAYVEAERRG
jgi:arsenite methyltransferase